MAPHRTALRFVATAATAVVCTAALSSASVAREMPGAAIASVTIDGNTIAAGVGAISRAAPLFPATDGDGGDARWIAAHVPVAARAGEAADSGRLEDSLYGVVHQTGMDGDFSTERELGGVREVILGVPAPSVREWVIGTFQLLASATVGGTKLVDQFHILVLKDSIDKKSSRSFLGLVFATTFNVRGTKMTVYIFRSGFLRHTAGPFIQDVAYFNAGRTTTDRSKSPLVVVTFAAA